MNRSIVIYVLGYILKTEGVLMSLPCLVALIYQEKEGFAYLIVGVISILLGQLLTMRKPKDYVIYLKEGCVATSLSWILMGVVGAIPFMITGEIPSFINALFEMVSGFTTTGASILSDVEVVSRCSTTWRCFSHWIGGMGVLVFIIAIVPLSGGSNINLMRAESPGPSVGKLVPKVKHTAILYIIYLGLSLIEFIILLLAKMPVFDAMNTTFGTAGTGGFGIKNSSLGGYSVTIQWIVTVFMILFGVNFNAYYLMLFGSIKKALTMEEVRAYFGIILTSIVIITINIYSMCSSVWDAITKSAFQVGSIITTTGFSTIDFNLWPQTSKTILVLLMFVGACAGSTGGGIKVSRFVILIKTMVKELNSYIHPRSVRKIKVEGKPVEHEVIRSVNVYLITYVLVFVASVFLVSFEGKDLTTNFTAVAATFNNIGPGLELVGPTQNFAHFNVLSKLVMIFDMLAGRLELFPLLLLFHPVIIKEMFEDKRRYKKAKKMS
jgi:trk system potassium uptake protein TrkH